MPSAERWLIIETSSRAGAIGLFGPGFTPIITRLDPERRQVRDLAAMLQQTWTEAGLKPADLTGVMVSIGPGSYTGLRVGITTAKTLAYAAGIRLVAVPTFAAVAYDQPPGRYLIAGDALQGTVYRQIFDCRVTDVVPEDELRIMPLAELPPEAELPRRMDAVPSIEAVYAIGSGFAPLSREEMFALEPLYLRGSSAEEKAKRAAAAQ
ncbi:MAG: tRNA (adenosine(37)-N6)-threonylcarbamoyltransferase complex dimerization subunit type 1 TsaB [Gemmataceae bacterium]